MNLLRTANQWNIESKSRQLLCSLYMYMYICFVTIQVKQKLLTNTVDVHIYTYLHLNLAGNLKTSTLVNKRKVYFGLLADIAVFLLQPKI